MRVVSLIPSATEIVAALGCGDWIVGRSHECDHPAGIEALPVCTAPRLDLRGSSADIDKRVKDALKTALAVYEVKEGLLRELDPDVIITQSQCEICAVSLKDVEAAVCDWTGRNVRIVSLEPMCLNDVYQDIRRVAEALNVIEAGETLIRDMKTRIAAIEAKTRALPSRPSIACIEWTDPMMAAGNWVPEMVTLAGGTDPLGKAGEHAPWMDWDRLIGAEPNVVAFMPCGFGLERTDRESRVVIDNPNWSKLPAVREGRTYITNGNAFFNRPGPRLVESLEILAEILHPDTFQFGHEGSGWQAVRTA
ncbi:MAG: cobalamin-binding protein [Rhodospirillales bacterium]